MSVNLVGKERLGAVLDGNERITISNLTSDDDLTINTFVLALHRSDGSVRYRTSVGAPLVPGDTLVIDDDRPLDERIIAVEALMRVSGNAPSLITDAYVKLEIEGGATSLGDIELGVCSIDDVEVEGATAIDEAPSFAVFARGFATD